MLRFEGVLTMSILPNAHEIDRLINFLVKGLSLQLGDKLQQMPKWVREGACVVRLDDDHDNAG